MLGLAINNAQTIRVPKIERLEAQQARMATRMTICADMQAGKDGAIEWGDPLCVMPSVKAGLCSKHYYAWYRWRVTNGVDTSRDHEPAA